jgi:hypothetical protein
MRIIQHARRRYGARIIAAAFIVTSAFVFPNVAFATTEGSTGQATQQKLIAGKDRPINSAAAADSAVSELAYQIKRFAAKKYPDRLVGGSWDSKHSYLTLYWNGPIPDDIASLKSGKPSGVRIGFAQVPYPRNILLSEAKKISKSYAFVASAGISDDFQHLTVKVDTQKISLASVTIQSSLPVTLEAARGGFTPCIALMTKILFGVELG